MATVGVRALKNRQSEFLRLAKAGERIVVTERGRPVAVISPPAAGPADEGIERLLREGLARWGGGKPRGLSRPPKIKGRTVADIVIEERR